MYFLDRMTGLTVPVLSLSRGFLRSVGDADLLHLGQSGSDQQQHTCEQLQTIGEPGKCQRPAKRGVNAGQTLGPFQLLGLSQGLVGVADVEADPAQGQQAWGGERTLLTSLLYLAKETKVIDRTMTVTFTCNEVKEHFHLIAEETGENVDRKQQNVCRGCRKTLAVSLKWKMLLWEVCVRDDDNGRGCGQGRCAGLSGTSVKIKLQYLQKQDPKRSQQLGVQTWTRTRPSCRWGEALNKVTRQLQLDSCRY